MALTQDDINNIVNGIVNTYTNQRIAYHGGYPGECTSPVKYYVENVTGQQAPYMANDRADGWGTDFPAELAPFFYHEAYQPGKAYPKGTVLMWNSPHIAIVVYDNGSNTIEVFEQNADPDGSPCKTASRTVNNAYHSCTYAMIPIVVNPQPTPPPPPAPKYTVIETYPQGKQIQLNKDTSLWGMNYEFAYMVDHPVETGHKAGEIWTVTNKVHHEDGYDYYRRDGQVDGFNVADCDDYTPPAPPYVPPSAPVQVPGVTYYTIQPDVIKYYDTAADAKNDTNAKGVKAKGQYIELTRDGIAIKLVKSNSEVAGDFWINDFDNKPAEVVAAAPTLPVDPPKPVQETVDVTPAPTAEKLSYGWIREDRQPVWFHTLNVSQQVIKDLEHPDTVTPAGLPANKNVRFSMWTKKGSVVYFIPTLSIQNGYRHGVPETLLHGIGPDLPHLSPVQTVEEDAKTWMDFIETEAKRTYTMIRDISPAKLSQATVKTKQFIDGFKAGRKR